MPVLANARYERFAQIVADGKLTPTAAYRKTLGANARDPDVVLPHIDPSWRIQ
jgi:hypothetical protein